MELYATDALVMRYSKFIIKRVTLSLDESDGQISTLDLGLSGEFALGALKIEYISCFVANLVS